MTDEINNDEFNGLEQQAPRRGRPPAGLHAPARENDDRRVMNYAKEENPDQFEIIGGLKFPKRQSSTFDYSQNKKLDIPQELLNNELNYRWVSEKEAAISRYESLGYVRVSEDDMQGVSVNRNTSSSEDSKVILMATPKKWAQERQSKKDEPRRKIEQQSQKQAIKKDGSVDEDLYVDKATSFRSGLEHI